MMQHQAALDTCIVETHHEFERWQPIYDQTADSVVEMERWCAENDIDAQYHTSETVFRLDGGKFVTMLWYIEDAGQRLMFVLRWGGKCQPGERI